MIIKKKQASPPKTPQPHPEAATFGELAHSTEAVAARPNVIQGHGEAVVPHVPSNPYAEATPEDFEAGRVPDRRRHDRQSDRRQAFRRDEDQMLLTRAEEEAIAIKERAEAQGFAEGLKKAEFELAQLSQQMTGFLSARETAMASASQDLGEMAVAIAESILKTEISCDEALVLSLVRNTIQKAGRGQKSVMIKVNPTDLAVVKAGIKEESGLSVSVEILVLEDPTVDPGSCMVETQAGLIDARFSTQLEILNKMIQTGGKA